MELSKEYNKEFEKNALTYRENIKSNKESLLEKKYNIFYPVIGKNYLNNNDLMILGRATNGWKPEFKFMDFKKSIIKTSIDYSQPEEKDECPFNWINENWGKMWRSAFWNVVYKLMIKNFERNDENWTWNLSWSNLMKIAPAEGGNPNGIEWEAQYEKSVDLFTLELNELKPKYVLMMTDFFTWGQYFLKRPGFEITKKYDDEYVEAIVNYNNTKIIVTVRPEGKLQEKFIKNVMDYIR